jgi:CO dehydrogenase/acetyl-CoA synthase epsilon subunit
MNEIREIVTRAVVAKGKKVFNLTEQVKTHEKPYSILGCWIINNEFEASKVDNIVKLDGEFEITIAVTAESNKSLVNMSVYGKRGKTRKKLKEHLSALINYIKSC